MTKRVVFTSAALAIGAAAFAVGVLAHRTSTESPGMVAASTTTPSATAVAAQSATPPAFPPGVSHPPHITQLSSGGKTVTCDQQVGTFWVDSGMMQGLPATPQELFQRSTVVVVVTATESHGYWQKDDGHLPAQNLTGLDYAPLTATNFSVERVLKGSAGPWLQLVDQGADPKNMAVCPKRAVVANGWPLPVVGQRYVLFLQLDAGRGINRDVLGPRDFFPVTNGTVHSPVSGVPDMSLDWFVARLN